MTTGPKRKDYTGRTFGKLTVIHEGVQSGRHRKWVCQCECGTLKEMFQTVLNAGAESCGCIRVQKATTHSDTGTKLHRVWINMRSRCNNPNAQYYAEYGGRGITICAAWNDYTVFKKWAITNGYREGITIDRRDNAGNYEPNNCWWVNRTAQQRNRRGQKGSSSGYIGVSFTPNNKINPWRTSIKVNGKSIALGDYPTEIDAAHARDDYIITNKLANFSMNF